MKTRKSPKKKPSDQITVHVRISSALHDRVVESAKEADRTVSAQVRQLLGKALGEPKQ
jgi:predicted HicB family RNase H-like nuclease